MTATTLSVPDRQRQRPRLRRLAVPVTEPAAACRIEPIPHEPVPADQGTLSLVPSLPPAPATHPRTLLIDPDGPSRWSVGPRPGSWDGTAGELPDPQTWAAQFVQAAVEVAAGARAAGQLVRWTTLDVHATLVRRAALSTRFDRTASTRRRAVVSTVMACLPVPAVCEASAVVLDRGRVRAVALRMEAQDGRWRVTALELG